LGISPKLQEGDLTEALAVELKTFARSKWPLTTDEWRKDKLASMLRMGRRRIKSLYEGERTARPRFEEVEKIRALIRAQEKAHAETNAQADRALEARIAELETQLAEVRALLVADAMAEGREQPRGDRRASHQQGRRASDRR
jgi:biopolymer transport protein ExbB/TolQ